MESLKTPPLYKKVVNFKQQLLDYFKDITVVLKKDWLLTLISYRILLR